MTPREWRTRWIEDRVREGWDQAFAELSFEILSPHKKSAAAYLQELGRAPAEPLPADASELATCFAKAERIRRDLDKAVALEERLEPDEPYPVPLVLAFPSLNMHLIATRPFEEGSDVEDREEHFATWVVPLAVALARGWRTSGYTFTKAHKRAVFGIVEERWPTLGRDIHAKVREYARAADWTPHEVKIWLTSQALLEAQAVRDEPRMVRIVSSWKVDERGTKASLAPFSELDALEYLRGFQALVFSRASRLLLEITSDLETTSARNDAVAAQLPAPVDDLSELTAAAQTAAAQFEDLVGAATERQSEVLSLLLTVWGEDPGCTFPEVKSRVAKRLGVDRKTVERHIERAVQRMA